MYLNGCGRTLLLQRAARYKYVLERTERDPVQRYEKGKTLIMAHDTSPQHTSITM